MRNLVIAVSVILTVAQPNIAGYPTQTAKTNGGQRSNCEALCEVYAATIKTRFPGSPLISKNVLSTLLELSVAHLRLPARNYIPIFKDYMSDIQSYVAEHGETRKMCRRLRICKALVENGGKRYENRYESTKQACETCKSAAIIVKASLDLMSNSFGRADIIARRACTIFGSGPAEVKYCLNIVNGVDNLNSDIFSKLETIKICEVLGFCKSTNISFLSSCGFNTHKNSPWATAFSILRKGSDLFFSKTKKPSDIFKSIREEEVFNKIERCFTKTKQIGKNVEKRQRRSLEDDQCPICSKIKNMVSSVLMEESSKYSSNMEKVCESLSSPKSQKVCKIISKLVNSIKTVGSAIFPETVCLTIACPEGNTKNRTCELCSGIQQNIQQEMKLFNGFVDIVINQLEKICTTVRSTKVQKECDKAGKMLSKISDLLQQIFSREQFCNKLALC